MRTSMVTWSQGKVSTRGAVTASGCYLDLGILSSAVTAAVFEVMVVRGDVSMSTDLGRLLDRPSTGITVYELLSHTSGLPAWPSPADATSRRRRAKDPVAGYDHAALARDVAMIDTHRTGKRGVRVFSAWGYVLLGEALRLRYGSLEQALETNLFDNIGAMDIVVGAREPYVLSARHRSDIPTVCAAAVGFSATAEAIGTFLEATFNGPLAALPRLAWVSSADQFELVSAGRYSNCVAKGRQTPGFHWSFVHAVGSSLTRCEQAAAEAMALGGAATQYQRLQSVAAEGNTTLVHADTAPRLAVPVAGYPAITQQTPIVSPPPREVHAFPTADRAPDTAQIPRVHLPQMGHQTTRTADAMTAPTSPRRASNAATTGLSALVRDATAVHQESSESTSDVLDLTQSLPQYQRSHEAPRYRYQTPVEPDVTDRARELDEADSGEPATGAHSVEWRGHETHRADAPSWTAIASEGPRSPQVPGAIDVKGIRVVAHVAERSGRLSDPGQLPQADSNAPVYHSDHLAPTELQPSVRRDQRDGSDSAAAGAPQTVPDAAADAADVNAQYAAFLKRRWRDHSRIGEEPEPPEFPR